MYAYMNGRFFNGFHVGKHTCHMDGMVGIYLQFFGIVGSLWFSKSNLCHKSEGFQPFPVKK